MEMANSNQFAVAGIRAPATSAGYSLLALGFYVAISLLLMYVGYFSPYDQDQFQIYAFFLLLNGLFYVFYFGFIAPPIASLYAWVFLFSFFPKKELNVEDMRSLLNEGLGFYNANLSMYLIVEVFAVMAIFAAFSLRVGSNEREARDSLLLYLGHACMAAVGFLHLVFALTDSFALSRIGADTVVLGLWPLVCGLVLYRAAIKIITHVEQLEIVAMILVAGCAALVLEFVVGKFGLFPESVHYYVFNYRGAFRSINQSGDLFVGQLMIVGVSLSIWLYSRTKRTTFWVLPILFAWVTAETYNRVSVYAFVATAAIFFYFYSPESKRKLLMATAVGVPLIIAAAIVMNWDFSVINQLLDVGGVKEGGFFDSSSTFERLGAVARGIDVFLYAPFLGVGPGNVIPFMSYVPRVMHEVVTNPVAESFYEYLAFGIHETNPHNLMALNLAEFGVVALMAAAGVIIFIFRSFKRLFVSANHVKICGLSAFVGLCVYYLFQAWPLSYGLAFLMAFFCVFPDFQDESA